MTLGGDNPAPAQGHPPDPRAILSDGEIEALLAPLSSGPARVLVVAGPDEWPSIAEAFDRLGIRARHERLWQRALDRLREEGAGLIVATDRALRGARETFIRRVREAAGSPALLLAVPGPPPLSPDGIVGLPPSAAELARWVLVPER